MPVSALRPEPVGAQHPHDEVGSHRKTLKIAIQSHGWETLTSNRRQSSFSVSVANALGKLLVVANALHVSACVAASVIVRGEHSAVWQVPLAWPQLASSVEAMEGEGGSPVWRGTWESVGFLQGGELLRAARDGGTVPS